MALLQPSVKKECNKVLLYVAIGVVLDVLVFFILNLIFPDSIPFDYTVIVGAVAGGAVAYLNFFLMCLTVQKVAADTDDARARNRMKVSYTYRYFMQIGWIVAAVLIPCFQPVAAVVPLLFPTLGIKIAAIFIRPKNAGQAPQGAVDETAEDAEYTETSEADKADDGDADCTEDKQ